VGMGGEKFDERNNHTGGRLMSQINIKIKRGSVSVKACVDYDFDPPESESGYGGSIGINGIELTHEDATELLLEIISDNLARTLFDRSCGYVEDLDEVRI
jgi:hypothetical protein